MQFVVENPGELGLDGCRSDGQRVGHGEGRLLLARIQSDLGFLGVAALADIDLLELDLGRVQGDGVARMNNAHINRFLAGKCRAPQIRRKSEAIVVGNNIVRQTLRHRSQRNQCDQDC